MATKKSNSEFKTLSKRAKLLLSREEGYDVEFKQSLSGLENSDIVAFANSESGGAILIGVREAKSTRGRQKAEIVGCNVGDKEKISIVSKAETCVPPVNLHIFVENSKRTPFLRIEIPSGESKPYSTSGGTYKIRGDGRTKALLPGRLLSMFVETESEKFIERFKDATKALEMNLTDTKDKVILEMSKLVGDIEDMDSNIRETLDVIFASAQRAEESSGEAQSLSDATGGVVYEVGEKIDGVISDLADVTDKLDALLDKFHIEDPKLTLVRTTAKRLITSFLKLRGRKNKKELFKILKGSIAGVRDEQLEEWYKETLSQIKGNKRSPSANSTSRPSKPPA